MSKEDADALASASSIDSVADKENRAYAYAMAALKEEGKQSAEAFFHNLNSLESRAGSQVGFGLGVW